MIPGDEVGKRRIIRLERDKEYDYYDFRIMTRKPGHVFVMGSWKTRMRYITWARWLSATEHWAVSPTVDRQTVVRTRDDSW